MNWRLYSFVIRSKQRKKILLSLEKAKTPTQVGSEVNISVSHVSRTLSQFVDKKIVECITPKEKIGRVYKLTKRGRDILRYIKEIKSSS